MQRLRRNHSQQNRWRLTCALPICATPDSVGAVLAQNLLAGGFDGEMYFVNPHAPTIAGAPAYANLAALPHAPDLAVIAIPAAGVAALVTALGHMGCRAAIVISAGDANVRAAILDAARPFLMRIIGPNCLGLLSPIAGLNASFAQLTPRRGDIALVTQSGALATAILDWAHARDIGFSHLLSLGDMADVDFGDALDFLALDRATKSILLYVEHITDARKFMSAARIAARAKPVIVVKAGRSAGGAKAAASHTGALAGADAVYDAAFRRAGVLRVETLRDLFDAAETLASGTRIKGDRLMIVTNGGGLGVLAADALERGGARLALLDDDARAQLSAVLPAQWSHANPIDIIGDADGARYTAALSVLRTHAPAADAVLVMNCPTGVVDTAECARAVAAMHTPNPSQPMLACWTGGASLAASASIFSAAKVPNFDAPEDAIKAFLQLSDYSANQRALLETPSPDATRDPTASVTVAKLLASVSAEGRTLLSEAEAKAVLASYGIIVAPTLTAPDPETAQSQAERIDGAVALKILSRDITHKSDVGGVVLDLAPDQVANAARAMRARVAKAAPGARLDGFSIEAMIKRPHAQELIAGASIDPTFGPVVLFGQGGVAVEIIADTAMALAPLNTALAYDLVARTRVARLLAGFRDHKPADLSAIAKTLVALSDLLVEHPTIAEMDINPLLADAQGAIALDARIILSPQPRTVRLAIAPYPQALSRRVILANRVPLDIRPLKAADTAALLKLAARTSASDLRLRFHGTIRADDPRGAARLCQLDYDREMALAAIAPDGDFAGVARVSFDPEYESGEFAILIRSDLHRLGVGAALMSDLLAYAKNRGAISVFGDVLAENTPMLNFVSALGALISGQEQGMRRVTFALT